MRLPIRWRLTLAFAAGTALVVAALGAFLYVRLKADLTETIDEGLLARAELVVTATEQGSPLAAEGAVTDPDDAFAQVLDAGGSVIDSDSTLSSTPILTPEEITSVKAPTFSEMPLAAAGGEVRVLALRRTGPSGSRFIVVATTLDDRNEALSRLLFLFGVGGPLAVALTTGLGWIVATAALRPVERMREEAQAISVSEPDRRLSVPAARDELQRLADTLNEMLDRLQESMRSERMFVDRASHELRTPLGVLKGELDLALARERSPEELETALRRSAEEVELLVRLAEDLLVLSRLQGGRLPIRREEDVRLDELLERTREGFAERAGSAGVHIDLRANGVRGDVDPTRVRQAVANLLDNAIRHTPDGGRVVVDASRTNGAVRLVVRDSGPGFPADLVPVAFDPLVRGDGDATGSGLGLAIVRAVAEAHGGRAVISSADEGGATVTLTLPG